MSKKLTVGKLLGIIFCILAAVCTVVLLCVNVYFGGQMKLIDKYFTAIERDDYDGYKSCVVEYMAISPNPGVITTEAVNEKYFNFDKMQIAAILPNSEKIHTKVDFVERIKTFPGEYAVMIDLTVYDDNAHETVNNIPIDITRENGKWLIMPYYDEYFEESLKERLSSDL